MVHKFWVETDLETMDENFRTLGQNFSKFLVMDVEKSGTFSFNIK